MFSMEAPMEKVQVVASWAYSIRKILLNCLQAVTEQVSVNVQ